MEIIILKNSFKLFHLDGKVFSSRNDFKLDWLLDRNEIEENERFAMHIGQDHFVKRKLNNNFINLLKIIIEKK